MKIFARLALAAIATTALMIPAAAAQAYAMCGMTVTVPGTVVTLDDDLVCSGTAITVLADNVTVDLAGHRIEGYPSSAGIDGDPTYAASVGVLVLGAYAVQIFDGSIDGFDATVASRDASYLWVHDLTADAPATYGIWVNQSHHVRIEDVALTGTWILDPKVPAGDATYEHGITVLDSAAVAINRTTIGRFNGDGIRAERLSGFVASGVTASDNLGNGIAMWESAGTITVEDSTFTRNWTGFDIHDSATGSVLSMETVAMTHNRYFGLLSTGVPRSSLVDMTASDNGGGGIWQCSSPDPYFGKETPFTTTINRALTSGNAKDGVALCGVGRWTVTNSTAADNAFNGFSFSGAGGLAALSGNTASRNGYSGIEWDFGAQGTSRDDRANGNGRNGVTLRSGSGTTFEVTGLSSTGNSWFGLEVRSGEARVFGGSFSSNRHDGIRVKGGARASIQSVSAVKNHWSGIAFAVGASGDGTTLTAIKNGRFGLCVSKGATYADHPPHTLTSNALGARGRYCDSTLGRP